MSGKKEAKNLPHRERTKIIGIAGSGHGVGTTHFAILTANYMSGVRGKKTAALEWNDSGAFEQMEQICVKKTVLNSAKDSFKVFEVSYLKGAGKEKLLGCISCGYEAVVIDFGDNWKIAEEELLHCDHRFLVGSFCEWQADAFAKLAVERRGINRGWDYFYAFGCEAAAKEMRRRLRVSIRRIPDARDAFLITGELLAFFEGFLDH